MNNTIYLLLLITLLLSLLLTPSIPVAVLRAGGTLRQRNNELRIVVQTLDPLHFLLLVSSPLEA